VPTVLTIWIVGPALAVYPVCYRTHSDPKHCDVDVDPDLGRVHYDLSNNRASHCRATATVSAESTTSMLQAHAQAKAKVVAMRLYQRRFLIQCGGIFILRILIGGR